MRYSWAMYALTLVASDQSLNPFHLARVEGLLDRQGIRFNAQASWLNPHVAVDLPLQDFPRPDQLAELYDLLAEDRIDALVTELSTRRKKLLLADMDATIIAGETLDDLAAAVGAGDAVAAITARAMAGELDFRAALSERLALLAGTPQKTLEAVRAAQRLNPGAQTLVRTMAAHDALCVLVSGGFTFFTAQAAAQAGFHHHHGNTLDIADGYLTGHVTEPVLGSDAKENWLREYATRLHIPLKLSIAVGDGANDLPMLQTAGLGVGYHSKPLLREKLPQHILYGDLTALLYAQGYHYRDFAHSSPPTAPNAP